MNGIQGCTVNGTNDLVMPTKLTKDKVKSIFPSYFDSYLYLCSLTACQSPEKDKI